MDLHQTLQDAFVGAERCHWGNGFLVAPAQGVIFAFPLLLFAPQEGVWAELDVKRSAVEEVYSRPEPA
eukprot:13083702-Alexandrium_andersonii.AAC.1